jgi:hypothetical protein
VNLDKSFFYATLGYNINDAWFVYASHWTTNSYRNDLVNVIKSKLTVPNVGFAYAHNERLTFKWQFGAADAQYDFPGLPDKFGDFHYTSLAVSVFF